MVSQSAAAATATATPIAAETPQESNTLFVGKKVSKKVATGTSGILSANRAAEGDEGTSKVATTALPLKSSMPLLDENDFVPGYDASKENLPPCGFYCPSFVKAEAIPPTTGITTKPLQTYAVPEGWRTSASRPNIYPDPGSIAALGPAGGGKSSAMNSIMNQRKVAFECGGQDRGTYVVHEYRAPLPDQSSKYRIVAKYYSWPDIQRDVVVYYGNLNAKALDDRESFDGSSDDEEGALQQRHDTAKCFLMDLLAHRKEFRTDESLEKYFDDNVDEEAFKVCGQLCDFITEFVESRDRYSNGEECYDVNSETEVQEVFKQLCRPRKARGTKHKEGSPWPILRKVVIYQSARILNAGVVLADTPGINDQNLAVVQNTYRYLKIAKTVLIFLSFKRINKNSPLDQLLRECIALGKAEHLRLVITSIDDMPEVDKDDLEADDKTDLEMAEKQCERIQTEIKQTEAAKKQAKGVDSDRFAEMVDRLENLQYGKMKASAAVRQTSIEIQCREIHNTLKGRIRAIDTSKSAPELPISFISNTQYGLYVQGFDPQDNDPKKTPFLDLQATGVPQLRAELLTITAQGKLNTLEGLVTNRLPNILKGITGILTKSKLERIAEVRKIIDKVFRKHTQPSASLQVDVLQAFEKQIGTTIINNLPEWKNMAQAHSEKWANINATTFKGFCVRKGTWTSHKIHFAVRCNGDLVNISAAKLAVAFNKLDSDIEGIKKDFSNGVQGLFGDLCETIKHSKDAQGNVLAPFFAFVHGMAIEIAEQVVVELAELKKKIVQCRHAATLDAEASYFAAGMDATWEQATLVSAKNQAPKELIKANTGGKRRKSKKPTVGAARMGLISNKLRGEAGEESIFLSVAQLAKEDLAQYMKTWSVKCNGVIEAGYGKIITYFVNHFQADEVKEENDPVIVDKIKAAVERATELLKTLEPHIEKCEAREAKGV